MGIVTGVALALHRQPEQREFRVYHTPSLAAGLEVQRQILQTGWLPPVMRQYDVRETRRTFRQWSTDAHGMLLMVHEGPAGRVAGRSICIFVLTSEKAPLRGATTISNPTQSRGKYLESSGKNTGRQRLNVDSCSFLCFDRIIHAIFFVF